MVWLLRQYLRFFHSTDTTSSPCQVLNPSSSSSQRRFTKVRLFCCYAEVQLLVLRWGILTMLSVSLSRSLLCLQVSKTRRVGSETSLTSFLLLFFVSRSEPQWASFKNGGQRRVLKHSTSSCLIIVTLSGPSFLFHSL